MKLRATIVATVLLASAAPSASGGVGIYGIVEKVVFEPNEQAPERVQVWGAFTYVGLGPSGTVVEPAKRGYIYFTMSPSDSTAQRAVVRAEWADLKAVAGTGQGVAFGAWLNILWDAPFTQPDGRPGVVTPRPAGAQDFRVRPESELLANPVSYATNLGVVKLTDANHGQILNTLRSALKR